MPQGGRMYLILTTVVNNDVTVVIGTATVYLALVYCLLSCLGGRKSA